MPKRFLVRSLSLGLLVLASACASAASGGESSGPRGDPDRITTAEIQGAQYSNTHDLVRALRPRWLVTRGAQSATQSGGIAVYVDNVRQGGLGSLRDIPLATVASLEYLDGGEATQRWGTGHNYGAILVSTRRR
jgi:hypothetical protein